MLFSRILCAFSLVRRRSASKLAEGDREPRAELPPGRWPDEVVSSVGSKVEYNLTLLLSVVPCTYSNRKRKLRNWQTNDSPRGQGTWSFLRADACLPPGSLPGARKIAAGEQE